MTDSNIQFDPIPDLIADFRAGKMIVLLDTDGPVKRAHLMIAADAVAADHINFMATHARGLVCLTLTPERCRELGLPLMGGEVLEDDSEQFTVSIEAVEGVTTGISAADRATTIRAAVAPGARPADIVQPGHVFPMMAATGGVLTRAGHTEAGSDIARMAGRFPAACTCEMLNTEGELMDAGQAAAFARQHGLLMGSIVALIEHRLHTEKTVHRASECELPTVFGDFRLYAYQEKLSGQLHFAMVAGELDPDTPPLVRVHVANPINDLTGNARQDAGWPLRDALTRIADEGGVAVILRNRHANDELLRQVQHYAEFPGAGNPPANRPPDLRVIGLGAQILLDLGVRRMRVMSSPKNYHGLAGFGLEVVEHIA